MTKCPLCRCLTHGGHACSTVPAPPVPLVVDLRGRRVAIAVVLYLVGRAVVGP